MKCHMTSRVTEDDSENLSFSTIIPNISKDNAILLMSIQIDKNYSEHELLKPKISARILTM